MVLDLLFYLVVASVLLVAVILIFGLVTFTRGGEFNRKYGNKIMRARLYSQGFAIATILLFIYMRNQGG